MNALLLSLLKTIGQMLQIHQTQNSVELKNFIIKYGQDLIHSKTGQGK